MRFLLSFLLALSSILTFSAPALAPPMGGAHPVEIPRFEPVRPDELNGRGRVGRDILGRALPGELDLFRDWQPSPRERQKSELLQSLKVELKYDQIDAGVIKKLFTEYLSLSTNVEATVVATLDLLRKAPGQFEPSALDGVNPNLLVVRPLAEALKPLSDYAINTRVLPDLDRPVNRDDVVLLPFVDSIDGLAKLEQEIPLVWRARGGLVDNLIAGKFDSLDGNYFAPLKGKTVVIIGHLESIDGEAAFEIRTKERTSRYLPIKTISSASKSIGFNYLLLGCETADVSALGTATKINDLVALDAFKRVKNSPNARPTFKTVLSEISSAELRIEIDVRKLGPDSLVPIDLVDADGKVYTIYPASPPQGPLPPATTSSSQPLQAGFSNVSTVVASICVATPSSWARSRSFDQAIALLSNIWHTWLWWLIVFTICLPWAEIPLRHALATQDKVKAALYLPLTEMFMVGITLLFVFPFAVFEYSSLEQHGLLSIIVITIVVLFCLIGLLANLYEEYPDFRFSRLAATFLAVWLIFYSCGRAARGKPLILFGLRGDSRESVVPRVRRFLLTWNVHAPIMCAPRMSWRDGSATCISARRPRAAAPISRSSKAVAKARKCASR